MSAVQRRRTALAGVALLAALALTGCSASDVSDIGGHWKIGMPTAKDKHVVKAAATPKPKATATKATATPVDDLATGTATHTFSTGDGQVVVAWWTPQLAAGEQPGEAIPVEVHLGIKGAQPKRAYTLVAFDVSIDGKLVLADTGKWDVTPPYGYQAGITVPTGKPLTIELDATLQVATDATNTAFTHDSISDVLQVYQNAGR